MNIQAYRSARRHRITFLLLILALGASGCAARRFDQLMRSWQGHTLDDLFRTWGPPNYLYSDGAGGQIAVYVPAPAISRIFFADAMSRIVRTGWRGRWECCTS